MYMRGNDKQTILTNQQGMAAMVVVTILMFVISIIVLGFAQVIRREQRNSLDHQLSTQAYYAAESGLNLAQKRITENLSTISDITSCQDRNGLQNNYRISTADLNIGENAEITCLLISTKMRTLEYQSVGMSSVPVLVKADGGGIISDIFVSWETAGSTNLSGCTTTTTFPAGSEAAPWECTQGVIRLDMVPLADTTPNALKNNQYTSFFTPSRSSSASSSVPFAAGSMNNVVPIQCINPAGGPGTDTPRKCTVRISGLSGNAYALRLMSVYRESNVSVFAKNGSSTVTLIEGQVEIDSTAKAADVLKRVQARMPLSGSKVPDFAVTAGGGVCKRYQISGGVPSIDGNYPECNL